MIFNLFMVVASLFSISMVIPFLRILFGLQREIPHPGSFEMSSRSIQDNFNYFVANLINNHGAESALLIVIGIVVLMFFLRNLFTYLSTYYISPVRNGVVEDMRNRLFTKILSLPISFFSNERKGDLMSRMSNDAQEIDNSVMSSVQVIFKDPVIMILYLAFLLVLNYQLTLIILLLLPVASILLGRIGKSLRRKSLTGQIRLGLLTAITEETLHGLRIIKAFNSEKYAYGKAAGANRSYTKLSVKLFRRRNLASPLTEFLSILIFVVVLYIGSRSVLGNPESFGPESFIAYILVFSQILPPAKSFASAWYNMQKGLASLDRVEEILNADVKIYEAENPVQKEGFDHAIEFRNVSFAYTNEPVLKNISFALEKGKTLAIVGPSGSGKSTLVDLLPRFFDVDEGCILIDGVDIRQMRIKDLRALFGIVNQEAILFNDTFFNNIAFGRPDAKPESVERAAKIAFAHDFIMETPEGYEHNIGERGSKLSGGQRQRISIARAVFKNPPVLILDEATSALDSNSEKIVQEALDNLLQNRTSIVVAHRMSTIVKADHILVIYEGEIVEQGTHYELMALNGQYKKLYDLQMFK